MFLEQSAAAIANVPTPEVARFLALKSKEKSSSIEEDTTFTFSFFCKCFITGLEKSCATIKIDLKFLN